MEKISLKQLVLVLRRHLALVFFIGLFLLNISLALAQDGSIDVTKIALKWYYFVALFVGMTAHWLKGYQLGTIKVNFFVWFLSKAGTTIAAVIAGVAQMLGAITAGVVPTGDNVAWWVTAWAILYLGYTSDSIFNAANGKNATG
jgi:hypothetical protein